jgi:hypothetical protein
MRRSCEPTRFHRLSLAAVASLLAAALSACYVVPIDLRTGQPYPLPPSQEGGRTTTVVLPPASTAPQGPSVMTARLYPLNESANQAGMLTAVIVDTHGGRGTLTVGYRGDTLQGEATRVDATYASFGRVHNEVLGAAPRSFGGQRGIANAFGTRGVNAQCEYLISGPSQGTGVCLLSDGAKYQLHFGG